MTAPAVIRLLLADGSAEGFRILDKSNWTGRCLVTSRADYARVRVRDEWGRPGVYLLQGPPEADTRPKLYVGEADDVRNRLDEHARKKDWWTLAVAFTSTTDTLNKAHVRYLESRLIGLARDAGRSTLDNGTVPPVPPLSEVDRAEADGFLAELLVVVPLAGVAAFERLQEPAQGRPLLRAKGAGGADGRGRETPEGFVVEQGSRARRTVVASVQGTWVSESRDRLLVAGVLREDGDTYVFDRDHLFPSPSAAAAVVLGRSANGRVEWRAEDGRTLKQLQEEQLPPAS